LRQLRCCLALDDAVPFAVKFGVDSGFGRGPTLKVVLEAEEGFAMQGSFWHLVTILQILSFITFAIFI
jgi:hypothetical protein